METALEERAPPGCSQASSEPSAPSTNFESSASSELLRSQKTVKFKEEIRSSGGGSGSDGLPTEHAVERTDTAAPEEGEAQVAEDSQAPRAEETPNGSSSSSNSSSSSRPSGDNPEEKKGPAPLFRRQASRHQRIGTGVYAEGNRQKSKVFSAAIRTFESASLLRKTSTENRQAASPAPNVPCKGLSGFYQKLLGENWEEQLQEIDEQEVENVFPEEGGNGRKTMDVVSLNIPSVSQHYQGKFRQRIRRRDVQTTQDISDQVADDLQVADDEPLISADEIVEIRESAWRPAGEAIPPLSSLRLGYHQAWDVGKRGCLAAKLDAIWTSSLATNRLRFFVMDGTDPEAFLTYYSKSDLQAARGLSSEKLGSISAWDLRDGHWTYPKAKVFIRRSDKQNRDCVLENFATDFYDAMLICLWEMETQAKIEQLKHQRQHERSKNRLSVSAPPGRGARLGGRLSVAVVSYKGSVHVHHGGAQPQQGNAPANQPQERRRQGGAPRGPRRPRDSIMLNLARALRLIGEKEIIFSWVEARLQKQRERRKHLEGSQAALPNGVPRVALTVEATTAPATISAAAKPAAATPAAATLAAKQPHESRRSTRGIHMAHGLGGANLDSRGGNIDRSPLISPRDSQLQTGALFG